MRKVIYVLLSVLVVVGIIRIVYEYRLNKETLMKKAEFEKRQIDISSKGAPLVEKVKTAEEVDRIFYSKLTTCIPANLATEDGINFVIYGKKGNYCSFEKLSLSYNIICNVPMDVAKKYAISGQSSREYIDEINNNPKYCTISFEGFKTEREEKKN